MPISSLVRFDENQPKYFLGCCHVKTAALVIGTLQLIGFFCNLTSMAMVRWQVKHSLLASAGRPVPAAVADFNGTPPIEGNSRLNAATNDFLSRMASIETQLNGDRPMVASMDMAWSGILALCVVLSFYAIRFTRPYLMSPKLILDAVTAGLVSVSAATNLILIAGQSAPGQNAWSKFLMEFIAATICLYIFAVSLHCFKYLMEKRAFLDTASNILVLPVSGWLNSSHQNSGDVNVHDVPPAYPGPAHQNKALNPGLEEVESAPPSYDEARKLQDKNLANEV